MNELMTALKNPAAYPHPTREIIIISTHISDVLLTGNFAYKICKEVNLGFADFSTLQKRKEQCDKEFKVNTMLSPDLYYGVVPIVKERNGAVVVGGRGEIIEYAIKMKQLPPECTMDKLLEKNAVGPNHMRALAARIHTFHYIANTSPEISKFGEVSALQYNWDENFAQTKDRVPELISQDDFSFIQQKVHHFIQNNNALFSKRIQTNKIKQGHGDFHSGNIFIVGRDMYVFDAIVFNQRFPCCDVVADIAFMAMDLDFHHRHDLAELFIGVYQQFSSDNDIATLLPFYTCYYAYVRAKVNCFILDNKNLDEAMRHKIVEKAKEYFALAKRYAASL